MRFLKSKPKYYCNAASSSLLFHPSGDVGPCYYNRGYILGKYPTQTIDEIWNSKNHTNLIKSIKNAKFNLGCYQCKKDIDEGLYYSSGISKYDFIEIDKKESKFPSLMAFQLDNICNLECIMCSGEYSHLIRKNREKASAYISPYNDDFVEQLKKYIPYLKIAVFTGGEPLLIPLYYKIWDEIIRLNPDISVTITSNGTVLNDSIKEYFEKMNVSITVGIDAVDAGVYKNIRVNAKLEETLANIDYFNNYCLRKNTKFEIKTLITPQNYKVVQNLFYHRPVSFNYKYFEKERISSNFPIIVSGVFASEILNLRVCSIVHRHIYDLLNDMNPSYIRYESFYSNYPSVYVETSTNNYYRFQSILHQDFDKNEFKQRIILKIDEAKKGISNAPIKFLSSLLLNTYYSNFFGGSKAGNFNHTDFFTKMLMPFTDERMIELISYLPGHYLGVKEKSIYSKLFSTKLKYLRKLPSNNFEVKNLPKFSYKPQTRISYPNVNYEQIVDAGNILQYYIFDKDKLFEQMQFSDGLLNCYLDFNVLMQYYNIKLKNS